jgi:hypothetical protein
LGRKILAPTTVEAALRARHTLVAMVVAALLVLALALAAPVVAQEETTAQTTNGMQTVTKDKGTSDKQEELVQGGARQVEDSAEETGRQDDQRAADTLQGADALIIKDNTGAAPTVDRIEIDAADCDVDRGAVVTVEDENSQSASLTNAPDDGTRDTNEAEATIVAEPDQVVIEVTDGANLDPKFSPDAADEIGSVASSTGVTCGRDDDGGDAAGGAAGGDENQGDNTKNNDDLEDLSCEELLVLFRGESSSGEQYENSAAFADSEVWAQVEVCLEKEIVEGTAADEDLPDTGGPSVLALAVLGAVSAAAGLSVIRGGRR